MAITSAICNSFKEEILQGGQNLNASGSTPAGNTIKLALYSSNSATLSKSTTVYAAPSDGTADPTSTYEVTFFYLSIEPRTRPIKAFRASFSVLPDFISSLT